MNIQDFDNTNKTKDFEDITKDKKFQEVQDEYGDVIKKFIDEYGDKTEAELMSEMLKLIAKQKQQGTFDPVKLKQMAEAIAPMLTPEQRAKMYNLLNYLD